MLLNEMELDIDQITENLNAFEQFLDTLPEKALGLSVRVLVAAILFFVGSKLIKFIRGITKKSLQRANVETGIIQFLDGLLKACLYGLLVLIIAGNFGFDAASVVALVGSAGVTVGLALQGSLSNLAGGMLILLLKPFRVGDFIMESGHGTEGTVKEIGIFYTKLSMTDGKVVVLPNGSLANSSITNATDAPVRRIDLTVGISYDADIRKAKEVLMGVMDSDTDVLHSEPILVYVSNLGDSAVELGMRCYCENPVYWDVRWRLLENAKNALDDAEIEIPYQQVSVHMKTEEKMCNDNSGIALEKL
ncbi:MAG: mechanosensitive ion channel family protein [Lachnospiraceae bacterium]|nr:mechanosensitive ion channel family protein [Lachnospiraceae bacterium]